MECKHMYGMLLRDYQGEVEIVYTHDVSNKKNGHLCF